MVLRPNMVRPAPAPASEPAAAPAATAVGSGNRAGTQDLRRYPRRRPAGQPAAPAAAQLQLAAAIQILNGANAGRERRTDQDADHARQTGVQVAVIAKRPHGFHYPCRRRPVPGQNGKMLDAQAHQLADHDVIEIAGVKMEFFLKT